MGSTANAAPDAAACETARATLDKDRGRIAALMLTMSAEDEKAETPTRFRRMCAIDQEISSTAARLARTISAAPDSCLSADDRSAAGEMKRLSQPVPECKTAAAKDSAAKASATKDLTTTSRPVVPAKEARAAPARSRPAAAARPTEALGLMSDLY